MKRLRQKTLDECDGWREKRRKSSETPGTTLDECAEMNRRKFSETPSEWKTFTEVVLRFSVQIVNNLKIPGALFPWLIVPMFRYLTPNQLESLMRLSTESQKANELLLHLQFEGEHCDRRVFRKFVSSLCVEEEHKGHQYIANSLKEESPQAVWREIQFMAEEGRTPQRAYSSTNIRQIVLSLSPEIYKYLNVTALLPYFYIPENRFLSDCELKYLSQLPTEEKKVEELLLILDKERQQPYASFYKFVACVCSEPEHSGHREIVQYLIETKQVTQKMETCRLLVHIELKGDIVGKEFAKIEQKLWSTFENKDYDDVIQQTQRIRLDKTVPTDRKIVASCFEAVALVHQGKVVGNFQMAIYLLLWRTLPLCKESENAIILQGRVCQRLAQIYLQKKEPSNAERYFGIARGNLFFAGRGFDKFKMLCREAKLLAVSAPERRKEIEGLFDAALDNISGDEPYAKTCRESVLLSKAALCLNISFGTTQNKFICKQVTPDDATKASKILSYIKEGGLKGLNNMRECEFKLLTAELLRIEAEQLRQAVDQEHMRSRAVKRFQELINPKTENLNRNIVEIAEHRYHILKSIHSL